MIMMISVVVPVHNEADNLRSLAGEIQAVLSGKHMYEIVFVDDGSSDASASVLDTLQQQAPSIRVIRHLTCCGQSTAIATGVRHAVGPVIITLDGDGQNDPRDIDNLIDAYERMLKSAKRVMITGYRHRRQDTRWRRWSSRIANAVRSRLLQDQTPDTGCGLKVFSKDLFLSLPYFDHMHRFLPALVKRAGGSVQSVAVNHRPREKGSSHYGTLDRLSAGIIDLLGVMWLLLRNKNPEIEISD